MYPEKLNFIPPSDLPPDEQLTCAFCQAATEELADALAMVEHCLGQLTGEQIWFRDPSGVNPIGNLVLHLAGSLRQWVISGLGGAADVRDRPREFSDAALHSRQQLIATLRASVDEAKSTLARLNHANLMRTRSIQGFQMTGIAALGHAIPHFRGHTQEIIRATRLGVSRRLVAADTGARRVILILGRRSRR